MGVAIGAFLICFLASGRICFKRAIALLQLNLVGAVFFAYHVFVFVSGFAAYRAQEAMLVPEAELALNSGVDPHSFCPDDPVETLFCAYVETGDPLPDLGYFLHIPSVFEFKAQWDAGSAPLATVDLGDMIFDSVYSVEALAAGGWIPVAGGGVLILTNHPVYPLMAMTNSFSPIVIVTFLFWTVCLILLGPVHKRR